jgi:predicted secreted protein
VSSEPEEFNLSGVAGEPIDLPIAHGPATGYAWTLDLPEGVERIEDGPPRPIDPLTRLGAAAGGAIRVKAKRGEYHITARLARPWQPDKPVGVVEIHLKVE